MWYSKGFIIACGLLLANVTMGTSTFTFDDSTVTSADWK